MTSWNLRPQTYTEMLQLASTTGIWFIAFVASMIFAGTSQGTLVSVLLCAISFGTMVTFGSLFLQGLWRIDAKPLRESRYMDRKQPRKS